MISVTVEIIFYRAPLLTLVLEIEPKLKETTANVFVDGSMGVMVGETTRHSSIGHPPLHHPVACENIKCYSYDQMRQ